MAVRPCVQEWRRRCVLYNEVWLACQLHLTAPCMQKPASRPSWASCETMRAVPCFGASTGTNGARRCCPSCCAAELVLMHQHYQTIRSAHSCMLLLRACSLASFYQLMLTGVRTQCRSTLMRTDNHFFLLFPAWQGLLLLTDSSICRLGSPAPLACTGAHRDGRACIDWQPAVVPLHRASPKC